MNQLVKDNQYLTPIVKCVQTQCKSSILQISSGTERYEESEEIPWGNVTNTNINVETE